MLCLLVLSYQLHLNLNGNNKASCEAGYLHQSCEILNCENYTVIDLTIW